MKLLTVIVLALTLGGCSQITNKRVQNTLIGTGAGCLVGAGIGALSRTAHGVAIGTALGCGTGAIAGATYR